MIKAKDSDEEDDVPLNMDSAKQSAVDVSNRLLNALTDPTESPDPLGDLQRVDRALDILAALDDNERMRRHEQPQFVLEHYVSR